MWVLVGMFIGIVGQMLIWRSVYRSKKYQPVKTIAITLPTATVRKTKQ